MDRPNLQWLRIVSDSMRNPGNRRDSVEIGDLVAIDRDLEARGGDFVLVDLGGTVSLMKFEIKGSKRVVRYQNPAYSQEWEIDDEQVLGVVSFVGRQRSVNAEEVCHA